MTVQELAMFVPPDGATGPTQRAIWTHDMPPRHWLALLEVVNLLHIAGDDTSGDPQTLLGWLDIVADGIDLGQPGELMTRQYLAGNFWNGAIADAPPDILHALEAQALKLASNAVRFLGAIEEAIAALPAAAVPPAPPPAGGA